VSSLTNIPAQQQTSLFLRHVLASSRLNDVASVFDDNLLLTHLEAKKGVLCRFSFSLIEAFHQSHRDLVLFGTFTDRDVDFFCPFTDLV